MQKGMTLIELLVALSVAAVLLAVAVPSYERIRQSQELTSNTEVIFAFFEQTMQRAKRSNQDVTYSLTGNTGAWCIIASPSSSVSIASKCSGNDSYTSVNGVMISVSFNGFAASKNAVTPKFTYLGVRSRMNAGNITIANELGSAKIKFSNYGRMTICSDNGIGGYSPC